jgi:hypothetical protein
VTTPDVAELCTLMVRFKLTELVVGNVRLVRPPFVLAKELSDAEPKEEDQPSTEDEFARIKSLGVDDQDRALHLGRLE